jgi:hypothetical protein
MGEIFEYAMHPDPEVRQAFWEHYQEALEEQGVDLGRGQQQRPQAPSLPGTPDNYGYNQPSAIAFNDIGQFAQQYQLMTSGLPGVTPQAMAQFDQNILNTPGAFWAQHVFDLGEI